MALGSPLFYALPHVPHQAARMVSLKLQKRLAASVLKCGTRKIWMDPNEVSCAWRRNGEENDGLTDLSLFWAERISGCREVPRRRRLDAS